MHKFCRMVEVNLNCIQCNVTLRAAFLQLDFLANNMRNIGAVIAQLVTV